MRKFWECCFLVLLNIKLSIFLISCQQPLTTNNKLKNDVDSTSQNEFLYLNKKQILTPQQLVAVFPKQLSGLEKTNTKIDQITGSATAVYGNNKYEISIIDDLQHHYSNIYLFNKKYRKLHEAGIGKKTIKTVRDGYKTITTIDESGVTSISFVFKHRYIFEITGHNKQTPYMVWRFLELNKFHKLQ